jgi:ABC-type uncharacterized transport system permease subunit
MVTDPVAKVQVGCVAVNVGAAGVAGCALSVMFETEKYNQPHSVQSRM